MRQKNYEKLMSIYNDCFQGKIEHLYINVATTTDALIDENKGLYSYEALKTRLQVNKFETTTLRDYAQPVIRLMPLNHDEIFVLLKKIKQIFDINYHSQVDFSYKDIRDFMEEMYNKPGASEFLTPREVIRDFLNILNIIRQNPASDKKKLIADIQILDEREPLESLSETEQTPPPKQATDIEIQTEITERTTLASEINYWEKQIKNREIKPMLNRMSQIAGIIHEKNSLAGEKFALRHAETVIKLLRQYHIITASGVSSEESKESLRRITETLTLTLQAFEQELNNLLQADMLDMDAESKAYLQSLKNRGLIN
jgi:hypothetical protein